jgi:hypothetical protein
MPEPATDFVARHRVPDGAADGEPHPRRLIDVIAVLQVQNDARPSGTITAPDGRSEFFSPPHPVAGRQHRGQTATLARPLRRREDRIARPARVRIRRRKPCFLCRRRLFGWYVRLLTRDSRGVLLIVSKVGA